MNQKIGSLLYEQSDFSGGLITQFDSTKTPRNSYSLAVDVEMRRNVVTPRNRHAKQSAPAGYKNGLYAVGSQLYLFVDGVAYTRDIAAQNSFNVVGGWQAINATARVYAERIPITFNLFNRRATSVEVTTLVFNNSIAPFPECLSVGNGIDAEQVIYSDETAELVGTYAQWTQDSPSYMPIGTVRCFAIDKLFLSGGNKVYNSVTGRPTDFVINIDNAGNKSGDADTWYAAVSANELTSLKSADNGTVIATTAFGTFQITPDYTTTFWGEPFLRARTLFPVGAVNDKSFVNLNGDVAFISYTGIHTFNQVRQDRIESNNEPLGRKIRGLLQNPQTETCAVDFNDNAIFAVNTIYGRAGVVYENSLDQFTSLDLSFGHVRQFAVVNDPTEGPRLFFINESDELYEAYADDRKLSGRIYLGDFTKTSGIDSRVDTALLTFTNIKAGGLVRCGLWVDGSLRGEQMQTVTIDEPPAGDSALPRADRANTKQLSFEYAAGNNEGSRVGLMVEWDFDAELQCAAIYGESSPMPQQGGEINTTSELSIWFTSNTAQDSAIENETCVQTVVGDRYVFVPGANGEEFAQGLVTSVKALLFTATGARAMMNPGDTNCLLGAETACAAFAGAIKTDTLWVLGGMFDTSGAVGVDYVRTFRDKVFDSTKFAEITTIAGPIETTDAPLYYGDCGHGRTFKVSPIEGVEFFTYDPGLDTEAAVLTTGGIATGPTKNPQGFTSTSLQARIYAQWLENSDATFKVGICSLPAYNSTLEGGGYTELRHIGTGTSLVLSSGYDATLAYERTVVNGVTWVCIGAPYVLKMSASKLSLQCDVYNTATDTLVDTFTIVRPS